MKVYAVQVVEVATNTFPSDLVGHADIFNNVYLYKSWEEAVERADKFVGNDMIKLGVETIEGGFETESAYGNWDAGKDYLYQRYSNGGGMIVEIKTRDL